MSLYLAAKRVFAREGYVSTGMLQRYFQLPYFEARFILDRMIEEGFCKNQIDALPCKVVRYTN